MWLALLTALGLMLVIEGIMPFLNPGTFRRALAVVAQADDRVLRIVGLISMVAGVVLLYVARSLF
ncbi:MAG: DUF2065 domain-containing protein [Gammaproteobacteria bacterium]|nr:DUF2065 domain-containing protein [Gammaproteobacteria bacterium]MDE2345914.1 DUF2065 domain-containing protein [Gammaproteobacteria bacterium]